MTAPTTITDRPFARDEDIAAITQFLLHSYTLTGRLFNWDPRRWLGRVYHNTDIEYAEYRAKLPEIVHIWEDAGGQIVGVVIPEYDGGVFLQVHPDVRHIEPAMIDWAEAHLPRTNEAGEQELDIWAQEGDTFRSELLTRRGYTRTEAHEIIRRRPMSEPVPSFPYDESYTIRNMRKHPDDQRQLVALLNAAFNRTFHQPEEYRNFQESPYYRAEFDMVAEAPDGTLAANAGFTVHEKESFALIEPVCTHPDHQGKGLARAVMAEGLRRVQALGIDACFVGAWYSNPVSNHVYQSMGFRDGVSLYLWRRTLT